MQIKRTTYLFTFLPQVNKIHTLKGQEIYCLRGNFLSFLALYCIWNEMKRDWSYDFFKYMQSACIFQFQQHDKHFLNSIKVAEQSFQVPMPNRPFYSCVLSYLAMNASEAGVDLALIQTSLLFSCKCKLVSIRTT